jgi:galactokinase
MTADRAALLDRFRRTFGRPAQLVAEAPGRVNLIGEHTDYNDGHVLPLAIDRTVAVAVAGREGDIRAMALDCGEEDAFPPEGVTAAPGGGWRNYVRGVAWALGEAGYRLRGLDLAFTGDVPVNAGLSSSAALEVAMAAAFAAIAGDSLDGRELALLAQRAENGFVGVQCGIMDQLAAVFGEEGQALLIDCRSLEIEPLPLALEERGVRIVIVDSAVRRALGESPYNQRRRECAQAASALGATALRDVPAQALEARRAELPAVLYHRARHVVTEEARVAAAAGALRRGDLDALGRLLYESHESLRDDFEVSCPETDLLVELAAAVDGVLGARLTGAGFGGCTVNLVREEALDAFQRQVVAAYGERSGLEAQMQMVRAARGLRVGDA